MTTVNVTTTNNTVDVTTETGTVVVQVPVTSTVTATSVGPQGATGTTGAAGVPGAAGPPKSLTIAYPVAGDNLTLFYTQTSTTLTQVAAILLGTSSPSVTYSLKYAANRSAAGIAATTSTTVTSTTTASTATLQNMPIPANNFLWLEVSGISGNPTELSITVAV
jgi:hypothetical protein